MTVTGSALLRRHGRAATLLRTDDGALRLAPHALHESAAPIGAAVLRDGTVVGVVTRHPADRDDDTNVVRRWPR